MQLFVLLLVAGLFGCKEKAGSDVNFISKNEPHVNSLVKSNQEAWLKNEANLSSLGHIETFVVFGDSLSDQGRLNKNTFGFMVKPDTYWKSRWSGGPNWVDYVTGATEWNTLNYAVGGAETRSKEKFTERLVIPDLFSQIEKFKKENRNFNYSSALFSIWIGPNNYFGTKNNNVEETVADIIKAGNSLRELGAKHIVLGTMTQLGISPSSYQKTEEERNYLFEKTKLHNSLLISKVENENKKLEDDPYMVFDAINFSIDAHSNYESYGFKDNVNACYNGSVSGKYEGQKFCEQPATTKYWDSLHPGTMMFCHYAVVFLNNIGALTNSKENSHARCKALAVNP